MKFIEEPSKRLAPRYKVKLATPEEELGEEMNFNFALEALEAGHEKGWEPCGMAMGHGVAIFYRKVTSLIINSEEGKA